MGDDHDLARLALAAVGQAPQPPLVGPADGVEAAPEARRDPGVGAVAVEGPELAAADLTAQLGGELELQAAIVDRPRAVGFQVEAVVGVGDECSCPEQ